MPPTALSEDLNTVNLADPYTFTRPDMDAVWRRFRHEAPVHRHPRTEFGPEFWVLSRYEDIKALYQDDQRFSSRPGNMLPSLHKPGGDPAAGKVLALTDAPRHNSLRTILLKAFSPRIRKFVVERLQERVDGLLRSTVSTGTFDFARDIAERIPMGTICDLLGFPPEDHARLLELSREALSSDEADQTDEDLWLARNELLVYCEDVIEKRRAEPQDDLLSAMIHGLVDGQPLTTDEVIVNAYGFILAGDHTSRLAMVSALLAFAQFPDQWQALKEGRTPIASAVEEVVRWATPVMHVGRTALTDVRLGGHTIHEGDIVTAWNTSANRDEDFFDDPDAFNLARADNKHLAFGFGPHFCFGSYLGRAEVTAVLKTLCETVDTIELRDEPKPLYSTFLRGYSSLPVYLGAHGAPAL